MIHARPDYMRFQEPDELLKYIYELGAIIQSVTIISEELKNEVTTRIGELNSKYRVRDPKSNPIPEDEPVFLFRATDVFFMPMIRHYQDLNYELNVADLHRGDVATSIVDFINGPVSDWYKTHMMKYPDIPNTEDNDKTIS